MNHVCLGVVLLLLYCIMIYAFCLLYDFTYQQPKGEKPMQRVFQQTINLGPALAANHAFNFKCPFPCQLVHVSLCNSTANVGTLKIGSGSDDDAYLLAENFGASGSPAEVSTPAGFDGADAGGQYPHFADGDIISVLVTDHVSHMANVMVVLTFTEG
jgi:hypothetical protein